MPELQLYITLFMHLVMLVCMHIDPVSTDRSIARRLRLGCTVDQEHLVDHYMRSDLRTCSTHYYIESTLSLLLF